MPVTSEEPLVGGPPRQIRVAGALVGVQALLGIGFAVLLAVRALSPDVPVGAVVGEAGYFVVIGGALLAVGVGLVAGRRWARTPAIVTQLLLLPVVYSLLGPSRQLVLGIVAGAFVVTTLLLLISERSREWSMGLDLPDAPRPDTGSG
ncbi:MAG: hypothetical protein ACR2GH_02190 [Pseudonocardia sp.]